MRRADRRRLGRPSELPPGQSWYDVELPEFPFGFKYVESIHAATLESATRVAKERHGSKALATLALKPRRGRRQLARDLGQSRKP